MGGVGGWVPRGVPQLTAGTEMQAAGQAVTEGHVGAAAVGMQLRYAVLCCALQTLQMVGPGPSRCRVRLQGGPRARPLGPQESQRVAEWVEIAIHHLRRGRPCLRCKLQVCQNGNPPPSCSPPSVAAPRLIQPARRSSPVRCGLSGVGGAFPSQHHNNTLLPGRPSGSCKITCNLSASRFEPAAQLRQGAAAWAEQPAKRAPKPHLQLKVPRTRRSKGSSTHAPTSPNRKKPL